LRAAYENASLTRLFTGEFRFLTLIQFGDRPDAVPALAHAGRVESIGGIAVEYQPAEIATLTTTQFAGQTGGNFSGFLFGTLPGLFRRKRRKFIAYEALACRDDDEAVATAKQFVNDHDIEVWCKDRFVRRLVRPGRKKLRHFRITKSPRWNQEDNRRLLELRASRMLIAGIAKELKRTESAITARLVILKRKRRLSGEI
jgi:hypothetical protein